VSPLVILLGAAVAVACAGEAGPLSLDDGAVLGLDRVEGEDAAIPDAGTSDAEAPAPSDVPVSGCGCDFAGRRAVYGEIALLIALVGCRRRRS
jgi:hypothetical protein